MRLPRWLWPLLRLLRHLVASVQSFPRPASPRHPLTDPQSVALDLLAETPLRQPDHTSCGSCVIVMVRMLRDPAYAARLAGATDPPGWFGDEALATRRRTNAALDRFGYPQLPWPAALGTRPAALVHDLGGGLVVRVVDPDDRGAAYDSLVRAGEPIVLYVGEGSWMQHIVLVVRATDERLTIYDPGRGRLVTRSRDAFVEGRLDLSGWPEPWLVVLPKS